MAFAGSERFELRRKLGEGGMGLVYEAHDHERNMRVALKTLHQLDASSLYRFKREFRALSDLSHPNIVTLYELGSHGDEWFLTMELVEGHDFISYVRAEPARSRAKPATEPSGRFADTADTLQIERRGASERAVSRNASGIRVPFDELVDEARLRRSLIQLAKALSALHVQGMVHRDLKPSNVRITDTGRAVLMDFGIVADVHDPRDLQLSMDAIGTHAYMAPEQATGDPPTAAADWYAFGVMLYLALTDHLPYSGPRDQVLIAKQEHDPTPPDQFVHGIPEDLVQLCMQLLERRPHDRPRSEDILARMGVSSQGPPVSDSTYTGSALFIGRDEEMGVLRDAYRTALRGETVCAFVRGASGMGKTALLRRFVREVEANAQEHIVVLTGRCHERESLSYKAFDGVVDDLSRVLLDLPASRVAAVLPKEVDLLTRLFPVLRRVPGIQTAHSMGGVNPNELRERAIDTLRGLLANLADWHPVVLFIDDLQWADMDSLGVLRALLRPPALSRILVLTSLRTLDDPAAPTAPDDIRAAIADIMATYPGRDIQLDPLSTDEQRVLVGKLLDGHAVPHEIGDRFWAQSQGNPLLLVELARYVQDAPQQISAGYRPRIEEVLHRRMTALPYAARTLLEVLAVAGEPTPLWLLAEAIDQSAEERERASAVLRVAHLARIARPGYQPWLSPYHNKVRETVREYVPPERQRELHQRLALAMERWEGATVDALARHWLAADDPAQAATYLVAAAQTASEKLAFDRAIDLYRAALDLTPAMGRDRLALLRPYGDALVLAGRSREAARIYEEAAALASREDAVELRRLAAHHLLRSGYIEDGMRRLSDVVDDLGLAPPGSRVGAAMDALSQRVRRAVRGRRYRPRSRSEIAARDLDRLDTLYAMSVCLGMLEPVHGAAVQSRHVLAALRHGEPHRVCRALAVDLAFSASVRTADSARSDETVRDIVLQARRLGDPTLLAIAHWCAGMVSHVAGHYRRAVESFGEAEQILANTVVGAQWERTTVRYFLCMSRLALGDIDASVANTVRALDAANRTEDLYAKTMFYTHPNTWRLLAADQPDEVLARLNDVEGLWPADRRYVAHIAIAACRGIARAYKGDFDSVREELPAWRAMMDQMRVCRLPALRVDLELCAAGAALAAGDVSGARAAGRALARLKTAHATGLAATIRGAIASHAGDADRAQRELTDAIAIFQESGMAHLCAGAQHRLGRLLDSAHGEDLIAKARAWAQGQGVAAPDRMLAFLTPGWDDAPGR